MAPSQSCLCNCKRGDSSKKDCVDWYNSGSRISGVYSSFIEGEFKDVLCDMKTDGGGWTVFQNRYKGDVAFHEKLWEDYSVGFGDLYGDYWLGNSWLHKLTEGHNNSVYISGMSFDGIRDNSKYIGFNISSAADKFRLTYNHLVRGYMESHEMRGMMFSTPDQDNNAIDENCASVHRSGWWHNGCFSLNFNSYWSDVKSIDYAKGLIWHTKLDSLYLSLKSSVMMVRREIKVLLHEDL